MTDEAELINAIRRDSESGFRILMKEKWEVVYWHIRRLVIHHSDAQDATQETFIRIFRSIDKFKGDSSLNVWIYRIATNEALRLIGKRRDNIISLEDNDSSEARTIADEEYVNYTDIEAVKLQNAILSLPTKQQLTFNLRYYDELEYEEIANIIDSTPSSVKASYHIAKEKIVRYMNA
jgi:RNA polymerase sigma factor, sigma-70 family